MSDSGHEAVGQALLISAISIGTLSVVQLSGAVVRTFSTMMTALG